MLLEFSTTNFKTFRNTVKFSLQAAPKQTGLDYSVLKKKIRRKTYKGLCSAVIYGPNAAGKTNLIGAIEILKSLILRGDINNLPHANTPNMALRFLELIPNSSLDQSEPVLFSVSFIKDGWHINYQLSIDLGLFSMTYSHRKIVEERLFVNEELIYERHQNDLDFHKLEVLKDFWSDDFNDSQKLTFAQSITKKSLSEVDLFLVNGFKTIFCPEFVDKILYWFEKQLTVVFRADALRIVKAFRPKDKAEMYVDEQINEAAKTFGADANQLVYLKDPDSNESTLTSVIVKDGKNPSYIPSEFYESYGTVRFINMFPLIVQALSQGGTLIIDEFDASIHPLALMNIVNIFHNDEINKFGAQLVFNTHNPIFLNANLFRRDEIKFIERDSMTHFSSYYSLADFGTAGRGGVRKNEDYMKNYFVDRYGAINNVDFSELFLHMVNEQAKG